MADAICAGLEARGIRCWIAPRDIVPGVNYAGQIYKAITTGNVFLIIITKNSTLSSHVLKEVEIAIQSVLAILPFRAQDVPLSDDMKYYLSNVQWLDAITLPVEQHITRLGDLTERLLKAPSVPVPIDKTNEVTTFVQQVSGPEKVETIRNTGTSPEMKPSSTATETAQRVEQLREKVVLIPPVVDDKSDNTPQKMTGMPKKTLLVAIGGVLLVALLVTGMLSGWLTPIAKPTQTITAQPLAAATALQVDTSPEATPQELTQIPEEYFGIGSTMISPIDGMVMNYVPEGEFLMGSSDIYNVNDEQPQHTVYLDAYWIDHTEITNEMYRKCFTDGGCLQPNDDEFSTLELTYNNSAYNNYPVVNVRWDQARAYCEWAGRQLPTEAQWEKAAKGTDDQLYPWLLRGPDPTLANYEGVRGETAEVGAFPQGASPFGAMDMAGNVWEWVADWYGFYFSGIETNPTGPTAGSEKIIRGGSWNFNESNLRTTNRQPIVPNEYNYGIGFRCVLPAE